MGVQCLSIYSKASNKLLLSGRDVNLKETHCLYIFFLQASKAGHLHVVQWLLRCYPENAESGCMWAFQELSEASGNEPLTGPKR